MFRNRRNSQKPDEEFYAAFKQSFPDVGPGTTAAASDNTPSHSDPALHRSASMSEAVIDAPSINRNFENVDESHKDQDTTPRSFADPWRLTPSLMDPNSIAFSAFVNQPPGYYTPTPGGGFNSFYHSSTAGDLHTPGMGMNTPLSLPHSLHGMHASDPALHFPNFNVHMLQNAHTFHDQFAHQQGHQSQQLYAPPSHFLQHQDSGYSGLDDSPHKITPNQSDAQSVPRGLAPGMPAFDQSMTPTNFASGEKYVDMSPGSGHANPGSRFRFHTTLNAPTAMVRQTDEIPITYLNKGQAYTMAIYDTAPPPTFPGMVVKYRTYVRVSFEDEQQRAKPGSCWQLWKEGRGSNEAHQRGGKLLAVEYVDPNQGGDEDLRKSQIELEQASFDGFAVTWYPQSRAAGAPDCSVSVRFNFLSTDFSHSKGVKGIPVRLCAKTELVSSVPGAPSHEPEVCFSKVKLFRDHGAERKLSNDIAHVKKSIDKLKQQITQAESGIGSVGKRKRSGSMAKGRRFVTTMQGFQTDHHHPDNTRLSAEEDLHLKLAGLQDMFSSTRPISVLFLKGDPEDDPDVFPVKLPGGEEIKSIQRTQTWDSRQSGSDSPASNISPTPSSTSPTPKRKFSELQPPTSAVTSRTTEDVVEDESAIKEGSASPGRPVKIQKREHDHKQIDLFALDVDDNYDPPAVERPIKPGKWSEFDVKSSTDTNVVACFYIRQKDAGTSYYRAIYLTQRTVQDLTNSIAEKFQVDAQRITRVTHVTSKGLHIVVDEDVVRELPEGQDMLVEFAPVKPERHLKHEYMPAAVPDIIVDASQAASADTDFESLEMWLNF